MYKIEIKGPIVSNTVGWLYHYLGWDACCPKDVIDGLEKANGDDVVLEINSGGGVCIYGYEMYTAIMGYKGHVEAHVINAMSAASILVCAADRALASDTAIFMIHNASTSASGDCQIMDKTSEELKAYDDGIINAYVRKTGKSREELQKMMNAESYMSPQAAIENGFIDDYLFGDPNASSSQEEKQNKANQTGSTLVLNASVPVMSEEKAKEIIAKLNLNNINAEGDSNDKIQIVQAIMGLEEKKTCIVNEQDSGDLSTSDKSIVDNEEEKGECAMTLEEFLAQNPEAKKEVDKMVEDAKTDGVLAERKRMKGLDSIAASVTDEVLKEAKYGENPIDAQTMAFNALKADGMKASAYMQNAVEDSDKSGVNEVGGSESDSDDPVDDSDALASYVNKKKGGK